MQAIAGVVTSPYLVSHLRALQPATITLIGGDADVWAWEHTVSGVAQGIDCEAVTVTVNKFSATAHLQGEQFSVTVPIEPGENVTAAACQGVTSDSRTYTGRLRRVPLSVIRIDVDGSHIVLDGSGSLPAENGGTPVVRWTWFARADNPAPITIVEPEELAGTILEGEIEGQRLVLAPPAVDGEYFFSLRVTDAEGHEDTSTTYFTVTNRQPFLANWDTENTAWVENAVVYGVIPRNFGDDGFQSIVDRLDALKDLGITALWLAPVNASPPGDYGYAVTDYFNVNRRYGTLEDFRRMVQEAHARGIRVLMDFVPNHSSDRHPYFVDTLLNGQDSPYWTFYDRDESGMYTYYFEWSHLPNLNYENPQVRRCMLEAFAYWVREFDVDGFRVDVAWGIRQRRPDFWPEWRRTLKRIKPDVLLLAEASARDEFYFTDGFDAAYDWTGQLGQWAWERVFEDANLLTFNLNSALTNMRNGFHPDALIFRFLNNNDTGMRFVTRYGVEMTRVATAMLLTLPGIPCIFTGDEIGAQFLPYGDPWPLAWDEDPFNLRAYYQKLIALRRSTPSLHSRDWTIVEVEPHQQVYGYMRHLADCTEPVLVLLNFSDEPQEVTVTMPAMFEDLAAKAWFQDFITDEVIWRAPASGEGFTIAMPPKRALILR